MGTKLWTSCRNCTRPSKRAGALGAWMGVSRHRERCIAPPRGGQCVPKRGRRKVDGRASVSGAPVHEGRVAKQILRGRSPPIRGCVQTMSGRCTDKRRVEDVQYVPSYPANVGPSSAIPPHPNRKHRQEKEARRDPTSNQVPRSCPAPACSERDSRLQVLVDHGSLPQNCLQKLRDYIVGKWRFDSVRGHMAQERFEARIASKHASRFTIQVVPARSPQTLYPLKSDSNGFLFQAPGFIPVLGLRGFTYFGPGKRSGKDPVPNVMIWSAVGVQKCKF
ncbi:hypothetical protein C8R43DRAFT_943843 [Mycena crocata]|nr:hypothetical protein C8R43DRAFT_943843 [Mycena crocata]